MHLSWLKYLSSATPISYLRLPGVQEKCKPGAAMDSNFTFLHEYGYSPGTMDTRNLEAERAVNASGGGRSEEKKKRLTAEQMELLEKSFQEEVKLEPERKLRLAQELGLPPRQVTVWFQNRRARWKTKRLEHLYSTLKREFDAIAKEKEKLEEEVMNLKAQLEKKVQSCHGSITEAVEGDETVESTSTPPTQFKLNQFQASSCLNPHLVDYSSLLTIKDYYDLLTTLP